MMNYAQIAGDANQAIDTAKEQMYEKNRLAEKEYNTLSAPHEAQLRRLVSRFEDDAFSIACNANKPPYSCNGSRVKPDEINAVAEGLEMIWEHSNGHIYFLATWEQLEKEHENV
jgi:hypothetical protein